MGQEAKLGVLEYAIRKALKSVLLNGGISIDVRTSD